MKEFPKWMLALAGTNLIPILLCPFFLFGLQPFGTSDSGTVRLLLYVLTNLLWMVPVALFFVSLTLYRRCFGIPAVAVAVVGLLLTVTDVWLLARAL